MEEGEAVAKKPLEVKPVRVKVSGAGSTAYNGIYVQMTGGDSMRNGAPQLALVSKDDTFGEADPSRLIFRDVDTKGSKWWLFPGYFNDTAPSSQVPPEGGWQVSVGQHPAPSITVLLK